MSTTTSTPIVVAAAAAAATATAPNDSNDCKLDGPNQRQRQTEEEKRNEQRERMFCKLANPTLLFHYESPYLDGGASTSSILSSLECMALSHIPWTLHTEEDSNASTTPTTTTLTPTVTCTSKSSIPSNNNNNDSYNNDSYNYPTHHYLQWRHIQNYQGAESRLADGTRYARQALALDTSLSNDAHVRCVSKAHECYRMGLECYPNHVGLLTARGALYANEGEGDLARDSLERAIQYGRDELDSNFNGGVVKKVNDKDVGEDEEEEENWFHEFRTKEQVEEEVTVAKEYMKSIEEKLRVSRSRSSRPPPGPAVVPISNSTTSTDQHGTSSAIQWKDSAVTDALMEQQVMNGTNDNGVIQNIQQWGNGKKNVPKVYTLLEEPMASGDEDGSSSSKRVERLQTNRHRHRSLESSDDDNQNSLSSSYRNRRRRRKSSSHKKKRQRRRNEKRRKYKRQRGGGDESELEARNNTQDASDDEESDVDSSSRHGRNRRRKRRKEKSTKKHKKHRRRSYADSESDRNSNDSGEASSAKVVHE